MLLLRCYSGMGREGAGRISCCCWEIGGGGGGGGLLLLRLLFVFVHVTAVATEPGVGGIIVNSPRVLNENGKSVVVSSVVGSGSVGGYTWYYIVLVCDRDSEKRRACRR